MKKVLAISFYFPPFGGISVVRVAKFCKYLPAHGWQPVVLTIEPPTADRADPGLLQEVAAACRIHRTGFAATTPLQRFLSRPSASAFVRRVRALALRWRRRAVFPEESIRWLPEAVARARRLAGEEKPDAVFSSGDPVVNHLIARAVSRETRLPWIADFRDEWAVNPEFVRSAAQRRRCERMEQAIFEEARLITSVTRPVVDMLIERAPRMREKFRLIPNGYDPEDLAGLPPLPARGERFVISHVGNPYAVDLVPFFKAVKMLLELNLVPREKLLIRLVGDWGHYGVHRLLGLGDLVQIAAHVPHREAIAAQRESDLLLMVNTDRSGHYALAAKLLEYMASGRPVLAIVPGGSVMADCVRKSNTGMVAEPGRVEEIADAVHHFFDRWRKGRNTSEPDWTFLGQFDRKKLAGDLAALLDTL